MLVLLLLIAVPANIGAFDHTPFGASYFACRAGDPDIGDPGTRRRPGPALASDPSPTSTCHPA